MIQIHVHKIKAKANLGESEVGPLDCAISHCPPNDAPLSHLSRPAAITSTGPTYLPRSSSKIDDDERQLGC
jgi:hypothetical protein